MSDGNKIAHPIQVTPGSKEKVEDVVNRSQNMTMASLTEEEWQEWMQMSSPPRRISLFAKMKENPFVPIGCMATVAALVYGLVQFKRGNTKKSQLGMRLRVLAQGSTVVVIAIGALLTKRKEKDKTS